MYFKSLIIFLLLSGIAWFMHRIFSHQPEIPELAPQTRVRFCKFTYLKIVNPVEQMRQHNLQLGSAELERLTFLILEAAEFKIGHGGPYYWGSKLDLFVNGANNQNNIPDQHVMTWQYNGNVGIGTTNPGSLLTLRTGNNGTGMSFNPGTNPYFGTLAFNRESVTGAIFDPAGKAFQINNGGDDQNLHIQVYNGDGTLVTNNSLVISGTNGNVGIGTASLSERLSVEGKIRAREIKVETSNWPDYVFDRDYKILGLTALESYIKTHKHLPDMPSAKEVEANGVALGEMVKIQQKKIEELTLHLIKKEKEISILNIKNSKLENEQELMKGYMKKILSRIENIESKQNLPE